MRVLRVAGFRPLLVGEAVNAIGNWVALIAIWGFAAFRFHAGAGDLALLFVVLSVPGALLGPLLGVPIDRLGPRRTLILANALGFLAALALTRATSYGAVIALALPLGLIEALGAASVDALPPRLVADDDLLRANALLGGAQDLAIVLGPVVAAVVNARWGLSGAFALDAVTFLVGLGVAVRLAVDPLGDDAGESAWRSLQGGLGLAARTAGLRWALAVAALTYLLWGLFGVLEPLYVRDVLGRSETVFAALQAVFGVGLVTTSLGLAAVGGRLAQPRYVATATIVSGATAALYLGTTSLPVAFVGVFLWGIAVAFFYAPVKTLLQRYAPVTAHGRILSLNQSLEPLASLVAAPIVPAVLGVVGVQLLGILGGGVAAAAGVAALRLARRVPPTAPVGGAEIVVPSPDTAGRGHPAPG